MHLPLAIPRTLPSVGGMRPVPDPSPDRAPRAGQRGTRTGLHAIPCRAIDSTNAFVVAARTDANGLDPLGIAAGGVCHDLINLLSVTLGALHSVDPESLGGSALDAVERARDASGAAARLVAQFQHLVRRQDPKIEHLDVNELILGMGGILRSMLGPRASLEYRLCAEPWAVEVRGAAFENALVNLVVNARDAMKRRGTVIIETVNVPIESGRTIPDVWSVVPGDRVRVSVSDTGCGIAEADRECIFERLYTTKPVGEGSGLGLGSVVDFVNGAGGRITLDSEFGRGSTFGLLLPARTR